MLGKNLSKNAQVRTGLDYDSGTADRQGAAFDTQGFEGVLIITKFAAIAAGATTQVEAQSATDSGLSDAADLEDSGITVAADDDDQIFVIDVYRPQERYVCGYIEKDGSNATAEMMVYLGYGATTGPVTQDLDDEVTHEILASPDEGTA